MRGGIMYKQKDIVLIPFPYSDLTGFQQRPALIISNEKVNKTEDRICCLITTNSHKDDLEVKKDSFEEGKLPFKSFVKAHRVFSINEKIIRKKICSINHKFHKEVIKKLGEYIE
jgi:mRNA interferase MazF